MKSDNHGRNPSALVSLMFILLCIAVSPATVRLAWGQEGQAADGGPSGDAGVEGLSDKEKAQLREMGKQNPQATEKMIRRMDAQRGQAKNYGRQPKKIRKDLVECVAQLERHNKKTEEQQFIEAGSKLRTKLDWFQGNRVDIPVGIANEIAESLIPIFQRSQAFTSAYQYLPIEVAARYGNSQKVKNYLLGLLSGENEKTKNEAIHELAWSRSLRGDNEIFEALDKLNKAEGNKNLEILGAMSRLDRKRALPILLKEIESTKDMTVLHGDNDLISEYGEPELLEHVLKRIKDFPKATPAADNNPTIGIYPELLLAYIKKAEGDKLRLALEALEQTAMALGGSYPVLVAKLESPDPVSRRAVADCFDHLIKQGAFVNEQTLHDLEQRAGRENDEDVKKTVMETARLLKKRLNKTP